MLEVVNLVVGVIGVVATVIGTVVAIQQLRLQRRLVTPTTVADDRPADVPSRDWEPDRATASWSWPADLPDIPPPAVAGRGFRAMPAPVRWAVLLLLLLALYFASLTTLALAGLPFPTLAHRVYVGTICAHFVLAPALLALLVVRGRARMSTVAVMAVLIGLFLLSGLMGESSGCLEAIVIALALPVIALLALPASGQHFGFSTSRDRRQHLSGRSLVRRRRLITSIAVLVILDGLILTSTAIYIKHYDDTQALESFLPSVPVLAKDDTPAASIDE